MRKTIVIAGSASLRERMTYWRDFWRAKGYKVLAWPQQIVGDFLEVYPKVHRKFFQAITKTDVFFLANEDKNGIKGYIGPEAFAELVFATTQNLLYGRDIEIFLLKMPSQDVAAYEEIKLWLELGWVKLFH